MTPESGTTWLQFFTNQQKGEEMKRQATHLGDGAYASEGSYEGEVILTANHHDPGQATDVVVLDPSAVARLVQWLELSTTRTRDRSNTNKEGN